MYCVNCGETWDTETPGHDKSLDLFERTGKCLACVHELISDDAVTEFFGLGCIYDYSIMFAYKAEMLDYWNYKV